MPTTTVFLRDRSGTNLFDATMDPHLEEVCKEAGIDAHLWKPDELGISAPGDMEEPLEKALDALEELPPTPQRKHLMSWMGKYLNAVRECVANKIDARLEVTRIGDQSKAPV